VDAPNRRSLTPSRLGAALALALAVAAPHAARAGLPWTWWWQKAAPCGGCDAGPGFEGDWHWLRSPEQEKRVVIAHFNRYCVRCHGVDGRGVWDIPDVPDFTNPRWQACRSDAQLVRATLEGRGACMPPFRGTLTLDEAWAMARYLRTFVPGSEQPRPDKVPAEKPAEQVEKSIDQLPPPVKP
jgi:mono/diheme cytochrome c family protein